MAETSALGEQRIPWRKVADELGVELAPRLRAILRQLIAERGLQPALAEAQRVLSQVQAAGDGRLPTCLAFMLSGITIVDPATTYIDERASIARDSVVYPNTTIAGRTVIGQGSHIGPNTVVADSRVGDDCHVIASFVEGATLEDGVGVGPFSHLRPGTYLEAGVHIGDFVEVKASRLGRDSKAGHFSYIGDANVGSKVNIGAGTVTCNFDGVRKNRTVIEDGAFIGSDTMLVAPVAVGKGAATGAGAVVTKDVPPGTRVVGVPAQALPEASARGGGKVRKSRG
jgi:bifunctional UDP-N-acetylglucosamine pyrophosphorylase/glucosamine-1-phosphate N-acetyltransferase